MTEQFDAVHEPQHYIKASVRLEPIELTSRLDACLGQALNYVFRAPYKGNELEDLQKAIVYLERSYKLKTPKYKYREKDNVIRFLAGHFVDNSSDPLTRKVLYTLFFRSFANLDDCEKQAIKCIKERISEIGESDDGQ